MSPDESEFPGDPDDSDERADDEPSHWLSTLLSLLDRIESESPGRHERDRPLFDYDVSVRTGDDLLDDSRFGGSPFADEWTDRLGRGRDRNRNRDRDRERDRDEDADRDRSRNRDRGRTRRNRSSAAPSSSPSRLPSSSSSSDPSPSSGSSGSAPSSADAHRLTTRTRDDELLVIADVSGVEPDDVTVGFTDSTLVVVVSGTELERITVPWRDRTARAAINNGVLTVRIRPEESESRAGTGAETDTETDTEEDR